MLLGEVNSDAGLAQVAERCGFGSEETLRRSFLRVCGTTPGGYRARFGAPSPADQDQG